MRVFGYSSVSTSEQADEGVSLAAQAQQIAGYAMMKGWQVAEHFVERGVSGSIPLADRPEGKRLLTTIGKGDIVVSAKLDRAFRSAADALAVLEELKDSDACDTVSCTKARSLFISRCRSTSLRSNARNVRASGWMLLSLIQHRTWR
jgi:hypothetical protein